MTRSTVQPDPLRLWKLEATDEGLRLHLSAHWNVKQITVEDDNGSRQEWQYDSIRFTVPYGGSQESVNAFLASQQARLLLVAKTLWGAKHNEPALAGDEAKEFLDYVTQESIRAQLHPLAGQGEEIKAIRSELKALRAIVGGTPTEEFQRLDTVALLNTNKTGE